MKKFTTPAGTTNRHKWHKEAAAAVEKVARTFDMQRELWGTIGGDERESLVTVFSFGVDEPKNPEAVTIYEGLGERFSWQITKERAAEIAEAFRDCLPRCMETVPLEDHRTTPEQDTERAEQREADTAERNATAAEKSGRVEQLAAEYRKQYPDAIGEDSGKSSHARAAANLKRILQAQGLRVSVKSSSFSMGNSVTASVQTPDLTPERRKEIDAICNLFTYGTFDPMTDCQGYDTSDEGEAWELVQGRAKYCRADYKRSDEHRAAVSAFLGDEHDADNNSANHQVWSGVHCRAADFWAQWAEDHKPAEPAPRSNTGIHRDNGAGCEVQKHYHEKRGFDFWLVVPAERVERPEFERLRDSCKAAGGWYSRKWRNTPGGFAFTEQEQAGAWAVQEFGGDDTPPDGGKRERDKAHEWRPSGTSKKGAATAERLRGLADKLTEQIADKRGDHQENTPKRQREGMSRRIDADRLERTQQALEALAALHEAGEVPEVLARVTSKKAVFELVGTQTNSTGYYHVGDTHEPNNQTAAAVALWALIEGKSDEDKAAEELRQKINGLQFSKIAGYFPTPPELVARMIEAADISAADTILEPSAGAGAILDALPEDNLTVVYEINPTLCEILRGKGYDAQPVDFIEDSLGKSFVDGTFLFDKVLMNPPFENLQDIDHVQAAFDRLKAGGRLVAIMSPAPFFRDTKKARAFRTWFEEIGGEVEELEAGTFKESGTGVASKLVTIDKPEAERVSLNRPDAEAIEDEQLPAEAPGFEISEQPSLF
jgi:protein-L-isoaspartate O-methyltransferase